MTANEEAVRTEAQSSPTTLGVLHIDPSSNPGITSTGTWAAERAADTMSRIPLDVLDRTRLSLREGGPLSETTVLALHQGSIERVDGASFVLAGLPDGQTALLEFSPETSAPALPRPVARLPLPGGTLVWVHATDADVLHRYLRDIATERGPRALGPAPRLGIGTRMTTACWPAVFRAIGVAGIAANAIQNSVRELNFLDDLTAGRAAERNYAPGFGTIESGYTGSSFEGLWTWGVIDSLRFGGRALFGADADHIQIKRGQSGIAQAKRYVDSFRFYTFFTIDMADILEFTALSEPSDGAALELAGAAVGDPSILREVVRYHRGSPGRSGSSDPMPEALIHRLIAKYWRAFEALTEVDAHIRSVKEGEPYDLEFTIDEHPPEVAAFDCLSTELECLFIMDEAERRGLPVTHIAPNVGTEKGFDYRGDDGIDGFERRLRSLTDVIASRGKLIDIHSADDLSRETRAAVRRATRGQLHYKISPVLQLLFAEILELIHPELFVDWWDDAHAFAREEAVKGSRFAADCLAELVAKDADGRSSHDAVFHHYSFRYPGRRGADGQFLNRERFYRLSPEFYRRHEERVADYITELAAELLA